MGEGNKMRTEAKGRALLDLNAHAALPLPLARCRQHQLPAPAAHVHEGGRLCRLDLRHERQEEAQIHLLRPNAVRAQAYGQRPQQCFVVGGLLWVSKKCCGCQDYGCKG